MISRTLVCRAALAGLVALAGCGVEQDDGGESDESNLVFGNENGAAAFRKVRESLQKEVVEIEAASTTPIQIDSRTDGRTIASLVATKNRSAATNGRGETPRPLQGAFWMRGNPFADYLISFGNMHWSDDGKGTPYAYLSISAPGSFAFKRKVVAQGAAEGDFKFLPESCRVPQEDHALQRIANFAPTHDPSTFRRPIGEDLALIAAQPEGTRDARADAFVTAIQIAGQFPVEGRELHENGRDVHATYESRWNSSFTESSVQFIFVATAPGIFRSLIPARRVAVPEWLGSFSLAPHPDDPDIFIRKTFLAGTKAPNYYFLTRIVDADGRELPHFREFLKCVEERSGGEILQTVGSP